MEKAPKLLQRPPSPLATALSSRPPLLCHPEADDKGAGSGEGSAVAKGVGGGWAGGTPFIDNDPFRQQQSFCVRKIKKSAAAQDDGFVGRIKKIDSRADPYGLKSLVAGA